MRCLIPMCFVTVMSLSAPVAAQTPGPRPVVQVGVFSESVVVGSAYTTPGPTGALDSRVYAGACAFGAGASVPPNWAADAWRVLGQVINQTPEEVTVQVDWQRFVADGKPATAPEGTVRLTLRNGERSVLDSVAGHCSAEPHTVAFGVRYELRPSADASFLRFVTEPGGGARVGFGSAGSGGARSGSGSTGVGGAVAQPGSAALLGIVVDSVRPIAGATVTVRDVSGNVMRSETTSDQGAFRFSALSPGRYTLQVEKEGFKPIAVPPFTLLFNETRNIQRLALTPAAGLAADASTTPGSSFDVELWLVHRPPKGQDEVQQQVVRAALCGEMGSDVDAIRSGARQLCTGTQAPTEFRFSPVKIVVPQGGELTASVFGSFSIGGSAGGIRQMMFRTDRRTTFVPSKGTVREEATEAQGGGGVLIPLPGPGEVLSIEMPPVHVPNGGPPIADTFAIRVRVTPVRRN